ncbi:MAG TPA: 3-isopropylmalate dehydratase small subunit [Polyangiales bacterium]
MEDSKRIVITGKAISLDGNDIDTDRIIPARFLRCVTFDDLGSHSFEDDRKQLKEQGKRHAFDDPARQDARVLLVDRNFGCGSSREHAPQALMRWNKGISVVVGESFAEIFFGNCTALGVPCVTATHEAMQELKQEVASDPKLELSVDLQRKEAHCGKVRVALSLPDGVRKQLMTGRWDSSTELLEGKSASAAIAKTLPYFGHWR